MYVIIITIIFTIVNIILYYRQFKDIPCPFRLFMGEKMDRYRLDYGKIVENVKELRRIKNFSQLELSEKADLSMNTISKFEINQKQINLQTLIKIANAFDVDVNYLLGYKSKELSKQELLISSLIQDLTDEDKELLISILAAIRTHRQYKG